MREGTLDGERGYSTIILLDKVMSGINAWYVRGALKCSNKFIELKMSLKYITAILILSTFFRTV